MVTDCAVSLCKKLGKSGVSGFVNAFLRRFDEKFVQEEIAKLPNENERQSIALSYPLYALEMLKKEVLAKEKEKARKERTRRLIQRGAILEQYLNEPKKLTNEEVSEIVKYAFNTTYVKEYLKRFLKS